MISSAALSVTQLNTYIKMMFESDAALRRVTVQGEVSNFSGRYRSGHLYFAIKDDKSLIKAVMFSSNAKDVNFDLENGMMVYATGRVSVYERDGVYQLYVERLEPAGVGNMMLAFEQLKAKLDKEGIFDENKKRPLPAYPKKIGIATAENGAAIQDIKAVLSRRYPLAECILYSVNVQGKQCSVDNCLALDYFNSRDDIDLIMMCRGGGSKEDLWSYNDETLVRRVSTSSIPVLTGIGHEIDLSLSDLAADKYAPTPSAAAEIAVPNIDDIRLYCDSLTSRCQKAMNLKYNTLGSRLDNLLTRAKANQPKKRLDLKLTEIQNLMLRTKFSFGKILDKKELNLNRLMMKINSLDPSKTAKKGKILINGIEITSVKNVNVNDLLTINFDDGYVEARAEKIIEEKN